MGGEGQRSEGGLKKYRVTEHHTTMLSFEVEATSKEDAIEKASEMSWHEAVSEDTETTGKTLVEEIVERAEDAEAANNQA